jgi:predicted phosphodiesterase
MMAAGGAALAQDMLVTSGAATKAKWQAMPMNAKAWSGKAATCFSGHNHAPQKRSSAARLT